MPQAERGSLQLEGRLDPVIDGDVSLGESVDRKVGARRTLKVNEAADVVVLVELAEGGLGFFAREAEGRKRNSFAVVARYGKIPFDGFAEGHGGYRSRGKKICHGDTEA